MASWSASTPLFIRESGGNLGIGLRCQSNLVRVVLNGVEAGQKNIVHPWLGVEGQALTPALAASLGMAQPAGLLVNSLHAGSPAEQAGLRAGDVIVAVDGHAVEDPEAFHYRVATLPVGGEATFGVLRRGQRLEVRVALIAPPETTPRDTTTVTGRNPLSGATLENMSPAVSEETGIHGVDRGAVVINVQNGSVAARVGLQPGDMMVSINGTKIATVRDAVAAVRSATGGWRLSHPARQQRSYDDGGRMKKPASAPSLFAATAARPLADRLRPQKLADVVGQDHLLAPDAPIGRMVAAKRLASMILWGPPGCGKTTIARLAGRRSRICISSRFRRWRPASPICAKFSKPPHERRAAGQGTLLFIDEIHRFNRAQQDVLLPYVEDGTVTLVGATTENPSFELNGALLSRCQVLVLNRLDDAALELLLATRRENDERALPLDAEARIALKAMADGDGRYVLMMAEELLTLPPRPDTRPARNWLNSCSAAARLYDKAQESHYNLISALHKSLRGSDCDAALYWFARMLAGGEDPRYIARRLTRFASEDIGLADPQALPMALAAWEAYERMGSPEGELAIAELVIYLATAPKSNASYVAYGAARRAAKEYGSLMPPKHILNAPTKLMKDIGYGEGYEYDHDTAEGFSGQNYFPDDMARQEFYQPGRTRLRTRDQKTAGLLGGVAAQEECVASCPSPLSREQAPAGIHFISCDDGPPPSRG